jgi:hypothetical protein
VKKETGRNFIPALSGEYLPEQKLRSWAQEHFLSVVAMVAPQPNYALLDKVLPKYRLALSFEKGRKRSDSDIRHGWVEALIDVDLADREPRFRSSPSFNASREASLQTYEAAEELALWGKSFHLQGTPIYLTESATPEQAMSAWRASAWPLIAALETIFLWIFGKAGAPDKLKGIAWLRAQSRNPEVSRRTMAPPPLWRARQADIPKEPELLPPVQLSTIIFDPRAGISPKLLRDLDPDGPPLMEPKTVNSAGWYIEHEPEPAFRKRMRCDFDRWLVDYIARRKREAKAAGLVRGPGKRNLASFVWTAEYQVAKISVAKIAKKYGVRDDAVDDAIDRTLDLIQLQRRPGNRGPKRRNSR